MHAAAVPGPQLSDHDRPGGLGLASGSVGAVVVDHHNASCQGVRREVANGMGDARLIVVRSEDHGDGGPVDIGPREFVAGTSSAVEEREVSEDQERAEHDRRTG